MKVVVNSKIVEGPHGGKAWVLSLECGHLAVRPIPKFRFARKLRLSPRKVKCRVCEGGDVVMNGDA